MPIPRLSATQEIKSTEPPICFSTGTILDMANGNFLTSHDGTKYIINGGVGPTNAICGRPEKGKSTIAISLLVQCMERYPGSELIIYDTEYSHTDVRRLASFSSMYLDDPVKREAHIQDLMTRIFIKHLSEFTNIDEFLRWVAKEVYAPKEKMRKQFMVDTQIASVNDSKRLKIMAPTFIAIDSWSAGKTLAGMEASTAVDASDPANNMQYMRDGGAKNTTLTRILHAAVRYSVYFYTTAHVKDKGAEIGGRPGAHPTRDLQNMKAKDKINRVGSEFNFLVNSTWILETSTSIVEKDGTSVYPFSDRNTNPKEFNEVVIGSTRGKRKGSGDVVGVVSSQNYGLLPYLTNINLLKKFKYFGLGTDNARPRCVFYPDIIIYKKKTHEILRGDPKMLRAIEILAQLCYFQNYWTAPDHIKLPYDITPEDLAYRIEKSGKKDEIMSSRSWWSYDFEEIPYYSLFDILHLVKDIPPLEK